MLIQVPFFLALFQVLSGISMLARQGEGIGAMSRDQVAQFDRSSIFGAPLTASMLHGAGEQTAVIVLSVLMILAMTAAQFVTQRLTLARNAAPGRPGTRPSCGSKDPVLQPAAGVRPGRHPAPPRRPDLLDRHKHLDHGPAVLRPGPAARRR
jgi:hypothetical protein